MKQFVKKIIGLVICVYFVFMPILNAMANIGEVKADTYTKTNINDIDPNTEEIVNICHQVKYNVAYWTNRRLNFFSVDRIGANANLKNSVGWYVKVRDKNNRNKEYKMYVTNLTIEPIAGKKDKVNVFFNGRCDIEDNTWYRIDNDNPSLPILTLELFGHTIDFAPDQRVIREHSYTYTCRAKQKNSNSGQNNKYSDNQQIQQMIEEIKRKPDANVSSYNNWTTEPSDDSGYGYETEPIAVEKFIPTSDENKRLYIRNMYRSVLGRGASDDEVNAHFNNSIQRITLDIIMSPESKQKYSIDSLSNTDFVKLLYKLILRREGSAGDVAHYAGDLNVGVTRDSTIYKFVESGEFKTNVLDCQEVELGLDDDSRKLFICSLFRNALGRDPSENDINDHLKNTPQRNAFDVIFSPESVEKNGIYKMSNKDFVKFAYKVVLNRTEQDIANDPNGFNTNVRHLDLGNSRDSLVKAFSESQEFKDKRLKSSKNMSFDVNTCEAVYRKLISQGFQVYKRSDTSLLMYEDEINEVKNLDLSGKELKNLNGLSNFANLEKLIAQNNEFEDISELSKLTNLKYLNLNGCNLNKKVSAINSLNNLEELHLDNNAIDFFRLDSAISNLNNLKKLYINNNNLSDISTALDLPNIKEIYADNNKIAMFNSTKQLDALSLKNNTIKISNYGDTKDLPSLISSVQNSNSMLNANAEVILDNCQIIDNKIKMNNKNKTTITVKGGVADGTVINVYNSEIVIIMDDKALADRLQRILGSFAKERRDVDNRYYLFADNNYIESIYSLDLSTSQEDQAEITNITGLEIFKNLRALNLNGNKVSNFDKLSILKNLNTLEVRYNGIRNWSSIKNLTNLVQLDISNNSLTNTNGVEDLTKLNVLLLANNNIQNNLDGIKELKDLRTLSIINNNVENIDALRSINLQECYASFNKIMDCSPLTLKESVINIDLANNTVDLNVRGDRIDLPEIIRYAMDNVGVENLDLINCSISDNKVVLNNGSKVGQVIVKNGNASDTIINIKNIQDEKPFAVNVTYTKNADKTVTAKITSETPMVQIMGWDRNASRTEFTRVYEYNTRERISIESINHDVILQDVVVTGVESSKIPGMNVVYDNYDLTNGTVKCTITADVPMYLPSIWIGDGVLQWNISQDKKTISKVFSVNGEGNIQVITEENHNQMEALNERYRNGELSEEEYERQFAVINNKYVNVNRYVSVIDTEAPECNVEYSTTAPTKGSVKATIWANEDIDLVDKKNKIYSYVEGKDNHDRKTYGITLYYSRNANETVEVQDNAGNKSTVDISVNNIDTFVDGVNVHIKRNVVSNNNETVVVNANENISANESNSMLTAKVKQMYRTALQPEFRLASNINAGLLTVVADNENQQASGNQVSFEFDEPALGTIVATDATNNTDVAPYNTENIDKTNPYVSKNIIKNDDGTITVELNSEEEIQDADEIAGWTLSDDKKTLTKTFKFNGKETVSVKDLAGNETEVTVNINDINTIKYTVYFEKIENSSKYLVVISADRELQEVDGWKQLDNKKEMAKVFSVGENENLIINGVNDGSALVFIEVKDFEKSEAIEDDKQSDNTDVDYSGKVDNTQSPNELPQTGVFMLFGILLSMALAIITAITVITCEKDTEIE